MSRRCQASGTARSPCRASREAAVAQGLPDVFLRTRTYLSERPAPAFPEYARALGLPTTTPVEWAHGVAP